MEKFVNNIILEKVDSIIEERNNNGLYKDIQDEDSDYQEMLSEMDGDSDGY